MIVVNTLISAVIISIVVWVSKRNIALAGFLTALPITTLIALALSHNHLGDSNQTIEYAKSIFVAVPVTLLFFVPFLLAQKFELGFWTCYSGGIALLTLGYFIHSNIVKVI